MVLFKFPRDIKGAIIEKLTPDTKSIKAILCALTLNAVFGLLVTIINNLSPFLPWKVVFLALLGLVTLRIVFWVANHFRDKDLEEKQDYFRIAIFGLLYTGFDVLTLVERKLGRNGFILSNYLKDDVYLDTVYAESQVYLGLLLHILHFVIFCRLFNGKSIRSACLFSVVIWLTQMPTLFIPPFTEGMEKHDKMSMGFLWAPGIIVLLFILQYVTNDMPRMYRWQETSEKAPKTWVNYILLHPVYQVINGLLIVFTIFVLGIGTWVRNFIRFVGEKNVLGFDTENIYTNLLRQTNPMLRFKNIKGETTLLSQIHMVLYIILSPLLFYNLYAFGWNSRGWYYIWDWTVVQAGVICQLQSYYVFGPLLAKNHRSRWNLDNHSFWVVTLLPVVSTFVTLAGFLPQKEKRGKIQPTKED